MTPKANLFDFDRGAMRRFFAAMGEKSFRADQVIKWLYQGGVTRYADMTNLSKGLRVRLEELAETRLPELADDQVASDGTRKWLVRLADGNCVETVFIPEDGRGTLCVSSQVGCMLNCTFCATARQGFNRNLEAHEIIGQVWLADRALRDSASSGDRITNVVMMGMGEPLLNFDNVVTAMQLMLDDLAFGLSKRRVTLSTAGLVPQIDRLREVCPVSLAVSLHAPNDALRDQLVPLNRKYPIAVLMDACRRYVSGQPRRRITFEYVMLKGVNDSPRHADELVRILEGTPSKVNLIPFNAFPGAGYERSAPDVVDRFRELILAAGIMTVTRKTRGDNIDAACGQLVGRVSDRTRRAQRLQQAAGTAAF